MLKLTIAVLTIVLAGTASAAGWRNLRIDASDEQAFKESVAVFQKELTPSRRIAFARSLEDIWIDGERLAEEQQREYTDTDYLRQLHGLKYEDVVTLVDPTGKKEGQYRTEYYRSRTPSNTPVNTYYGNGLPLKPPGYGQTSVLP